MKIFKVIIALTTFIAINNAHALTFAQKSEFTRTYNSVINQLKKEQNLTSAQMETIKKYVNMPMDGDIKEGIDKLTKAGFDVGSLQQSAKSEELIKIEEPIQQETKASAPTAAITTRKRQTLADLKKSAQQQRQTARTEPTTQELIKIEEPIQQETKASAPTAAITTRKRQTLADLKKSAQQQRQTARTEQPVIKKTEPVTAATTPGKKLSLQEQRKLTPQQQQQTASSKAGTPDIWETGYTEPKSEEKFLPVGTSGWEGNVEDVAKTFYNATWKTINDKGLNDYIKMVQYAYPKISGRELQGRVYENAAAILREVRGEKELNKNIADELDEKIRSAIPAGEKYTYTPKKLVTEKKVETKITINPQTEAFLQISVSALSEKESPYKTFDDFVNATQKNIDAFVYNGQLNPNWFDLAIKLAQKFDFISNDDKKELLEQRANEIYNNYYKSKKMDYTDAQRTEITKEINFALVRISQ